MTTQTELNGLVLDERTLIYLVYSPETREVILYNVDEEHPIIAPRSIRVSLAMLKDTQHYLTIRFLKETADVGVKNV